MIDTKELRRLHNGDDFKLFADYCEEHIIALADSYDALVAERDTLQAEIYALQNKLGENL